MTAQLENSGAERGRKPRYRREQPEIRREMLIEAAMRSLSRDGIQGLTIDRICREAGVSRGLINHYFDGKDGLLIELYRDSLYASVRRRITRVFETATEDSDPATHLLAIVNATFAPEFFTRRSLQVWLALWGEIARNAELRTVHRDLYGGYRRQIADAVSRIAEARGADVDAEQLALSFVALVDGLWLEWCLDETAVDPPAARAATMAMLEAHLGPLGSPA